MMFALPAVIRGHRPGHAPTAAGWCVRMNWPDGTHCLVAFATTRRAAARRLPGLQHYWARGPLSPGRYQVVPISRHDWRLHAHRPGCASPDCPTGAPQ
jgi:hypothetical protein